MLAEAFLICVLATAPAAFSGHHALLNGNGASFYRFLKQDRKVLIVGGDPAFVLWLRQDGGRVFGALTDDWPGTTLQHAVADAGKLPFLPSTFDSIWWRMKNPANHPGFDWLTDVIPMIEPGAFLLFDSEEYPCWPGWLRGRNWERLPVRYKEYGIWKQPNHGDYFRRSA